MPDDKEDSLEEREEDDDDDESKDEDSGELDVQGFMEAFIYHSSSSLRGSLIRLETANGEDLGNFTKKELLDPKTVEIVKKNLQRMRLHRQEESVATRKIHSALELLNKATREAAAIGLKVEFQGQMVGSGVFGKQIDEEYCVQFTVEIYRRLT